MSEEQLAGGAAFRRLRDAIFTKPKTYNRDRVLLRPRRVLRGWKDVKGKIKISSSYIPLY